jgi:glycerol-3-phosphate cytidylyltransferase
MQAKKTVITYGTFDLLHIGHINLLRRAKQLGDFLIVGVTDEGYDRLRGKLNVHQSLADRVEGVAKTGIADLIIVERFIGQKVTDIRDHKVDVFTIGDDWLGKFDYLKSYCDVVYLPRTQGVSSTLLRNQSTQTIRLGVIGTGRISNRFATEAKFVNSVEITSALGRSMHNVDKYIKTHDIPYGFVDYEMFLESGIDAVYIASPHETHFDFAKAALLSNKHVLCEKPATLHATQLLDLITIAKERKLVFLEAIKTAFFQGFQCMLEDCKSGIIGEVFDVKASFTKLIPKNSAVEWRAFYGGAINELSSYPLFLAFSVLGGFKSTHFNSQFDNSIDFFSNIYCSHVGNKTSTSTVGIGVKTEGCAAISGSKGYIFIPAPWWLTKKYYIRFEDTREEIIKEFKFDGEGLRYEVAEFATLILRNQMESRHLTHTAMISINELISKHNEARIND